MYCNSSLYQFPCLPEMRHKGEHKTTYEKQPKLNPKFSGQTLHELLLQTSHPLFKGYDLWYTFDGDTIEFMTQTFYKANVKEVIKELLHYKQVFLDSVQSIFQAHTMHHEKGRVVFPPKNPGFVVHLTNPSNVCVFNNGTYHINLTLPSWLNAKGELLYPELFREQHRALARFLQWMEPLLLLEYGTSDPLAVTSNRFSALSQRAAMSRYIGIATFDTVAMPEGKRNTIPIEELVCAKEESWWYSSYHATSGYTVLKEVGLDINYKKHHNHGLELRCLDWFPEENLQSCIRKILLLAQASLQLPLAPVCTAMESWNTCVIGLHEEGRDYCPSRKTLAAYEKVLHIPLLEQTGQPMKRICTEIWNSLERLYGKGSLIKLFGG